MTYMNYDTLQMQMSILMRCRYKCPSIRVVDTNVLHFALQVQMSFDLRCRQKCALIGVVGTNVPRLVLQHKYVLIGVVDVDLCQDAEE